MTFFRKKQLDLIPSVPSDQTDRREAIQRSRKKLEEAKASVPKALKVVDSLQGHDSQNHYQQRLMLAYGKVIPNAD